MKRIEVLSLNSLLNPLDTKHLGDTTMLKVLKIKSSVNDSIVKIESDKKLFTDETKPDEFVEGAELTDELKNKWESKFQPVYGAYLVEDSELVFNKLSDTEFVELTKGAELTVETLTLLYNYLVKC